MTYWLTKRPELSPRITGAGSFHSQRIKSIRNKGRAGSPEQRESAVVSGVPAMIPEGPEGSSADLRYLCPSPLCEEAFMEAIEAEIRSSWGD
jgi:hypothetical protein